MSRTTLANTKWFFTSPLQLPQTAFLHNPLSVNFISGGIKWQSMYVGDESEGVLEYGSTTVYSNNAWTATTYRTVYFVDGVDIDDQDLIMFIEQSATEIPIETKLVNATALDSNLGAIATAIRSKTGDSSTIQYPDGFITQIGSISASKPEETKTVELSMASGNQTITPTSGSVLTSVTVNKPATMLPENIKDGVNIGGVIGTLSGGGGGIDNFTVNDTFHTFRGIILLFITDGTMGASHTFSITITHSNESKTITFDNSGTNHYLCFVGDGTNSVSGNITINVTSNYTDSDLKPTYSYVNIYESNYYVREAHGTAQSSRTDGTGSVNIPYYIGDNSYYNYILINGAMDTTEG